MAKPFLFPFIAKAVNLATKKGLEQLLLPSQHSLNKLF
jgi:hypothetical protein